MEVEPLHSLLKRLLLRPLLLWNVRVATHSEAMANSREQVDLVGNPRRLQDLLRLMSLLHWENRIRLRGRDRYRALSSLQLRLVHERRVRRVSDLDALPLLLGHESHHILSTKAVPYTCDFLIALLIEIVQRLDHDRVDLGDSVRVIALHAVLDPVHDVEVLGTPWVGQRVLVEDVRDQSVVPVGGELVGYQVGVLADATHIGNEDDGLARLGVRGLSNVDIEGAVVDGGMGAGCLASKRCVRIGF